MIKGTERDITSRRQARQDLFTFLNKIKFVSKHTNKIIETVTKELRELMLAIDQTDHMLDHAVEDYNESLDSIVECPQGEAPAYTAVAGYYRVTITNATVQSYVSVGVNRQRDLDEQHNKPDAMEDPHTHTIDGNPRNPQMEEPLRITSTENKFFQIKGDVRQMRWTAVPFGAEGVEKSITFKVDFTTVPAVDGTVVDRKWVEALPLRTYKKETTDLVLDICYAYNKMPVDM